MANATSGRCLEYASLSDLASHCIESAPTSVMRTVTRGVGEALHELESRRKSEKRTLILLKIVFDEQKRGLGTLLFDLNAVTAPDVPLGLEIVCAGQRDVRQPNRLRGCAAARARDTGHGQPERARKFFTNATGHFAHRLFADRAKRVEGIPGHSKRCDFGFIRVRNNRCDQIRGTSWHVRQARSEEHTS